MLTVATKYFGLEQDNRLKVVIDDGVKFLRKALKNGSNYKFDQQVLVKLMLIHLQVNHSRQFYLMLIVKIQQSA